MASDEDEGHLPLTTATQDHAPAESPGTETRRTSTTSAGLSDVGLQASQTSMQSDTRRTRPRPLDYGSIQSSTTGRIPQVSSPLPLTNPTTPKRPGPAKRLPSSAAPRKGQDFSADDGPDEVDLDLELARTKTRQQTQQQQRERQLRRRESTLRRRPTAQVPQLRTVESEEHEDEEYASATGVSSGNDAHAGAAVAVEQPKAPPQGDGGGDPGSEETLRGEEEEQREEEEEEREEEQEEEEEDEPATPEDEDEDDDADLSDAESFTLKDRQEAINETHPFGIRIWKPALYKKNRSVQKNAQDDIHSAPGGNVSRWLWVFNCLWTVIFGWWLALLAGFGGVINLTLAMALGVESCYDYGRVLINLSHYLFYPFGKYVKLERDEAYADEDEGEGRSISEYERWQTGDLEEGRLFFGPTDINRSIIGRRRDEVEDLDEPAADETDALLGRPGRRNSDAERARIRTKKRLFGRGKWNVGRVIFFLSFYFFLTPCLFLVSGICWFLVFTIPMGKVTLLLFDHLRRHPLALSFHTDSHYGRTSSMKPRRADGEDGRGGLGHSVLLCTYRAVGVKYWKYTIDGTNIFLINLLGLVAFAIFDYFVLYVALGVRTWLTSPGFVFVLALASIIPLAYFIGQAVASISAQSSMGVGATINAFFSTVVEVFLYCVALQQGKAQLVEGSIIGSIFAGILFLPGLSMCFGALKRKTQRFNVKSAGVTSTMLLFAVIGAFCPTLFYEMYGSHELNCHQCTTSEGNGGLMGEHPPDEDCRRCYFAQAPAAVHDRFYQEAVRPYIWFAAVCLFLSYVVGLLFTLRTHAAVIWNNEPDNEKKETTKGEERHVGGVVPGSGGLIVQDPPTSGGGGRPHMARGETAGTIGSLARENIRESQMYKRILNQSLKQAGFGPTMTHSPTAVKKDGEQQQMGSENGTPTKPGFTPAEGGQTPHMPPPKNADADAGSVKSVLQQPKIHGLSAEDNRALVQQVAEMAATAATVAARDATRAPRKSALMATTSSMSVRHHGSKDSKDSSGATHRGAGAVEPGSTADLEVPNDGPATGGGPATTEKHGEEHPAEGGHDAPNWSRTKSAVILLTATVAYAVIAEILVDTVDSVLSNIDIDEKFLGITLFALVPNTTEFLNAISFAMNGNVALSMEIGSSYALQVMLLQIPCLVLFSEVYGRYIDPEDVIDHTFSLIFPQWDMVTVILGVFLMGWVVGEGKSNYFKGSTLIFTYLVVAVGFWFSGYGDMQTMGIERFDTAETFKVVGRARSGRAY